MAILRTITCLTLFNYHLIEHGWDPRNDLSLVLALLPYGLIACQMLQMVLMPRGRALELAQHFVLVDAITTIPYFFRHGGYPLVPTVAPQFAIEFVGGHVQNVGRPLGRVNAHRVSDDSIALVALPLFMLSC